MCETVASTEIPQFSVIKNVYVPTKTMILEIDLISFTFCLATAFLDDAINFLEGINKSRFTNLYSRPKFSVPQST